MDARSEFFVYMGAALATVAALFAVQICYASYVDVAVVNAPNTDAPMDAKLEAVRSAESAKLAGSAVSIEQAMHAVAERGRAASPKLAPQPSEDLSAMSGWIHRPGFAPYEPRQAPAPAPAAEPTDGGVPVEGAEAAATAPAASAPAAPAAPAAVEAPPRTKVAVGVAKPLVIKPAATKVKVAP